MRECLRWEYCMVMSAMIILIGAFEIIGLWSVRSDPMLFGIGVILSGGVLLLISTIGYLDSVMDEVQEMLDNIHNDMYMYITEQKR